MTNDNFDAFIKTLSNIIATVIVDFALLCLRTWLLTICMSFVLPSFTLGFWSWMLIVFTIRSIFVPVKSFK